MKINSVCWVTQYLPSTSGNVMEIHYSPSHAVSTEHLRQYDGISVCTEWSSANSVYRVISHLPSHQWLPSSEILKAVSMNRVFTSTESMTMPGNVVDTVYQKVTELVQWTRVVYCWADSVKDFHLCYWPTLLWLYNLKDIYIMYVLCRNSESEK